MPLHSDDEREWRVESAGPANMKNVRNVGRLVMAAECEYASVDCQARCKFLFRGEIEDERDEVLRGGVAVGSETIFIAAVSRVVRARV
jgi:hypothetical protein